MPKLKKVVITSESPACIDEIWERLQKLETLQYIASPYAKFSPVNGSIMTWEVGREYAFKLKLFGFISMGVHTINVLEFSKETLTIYTREHNKSVPIWNHRIVLQEISQNKTLYTDEVEVYAGFITPLVVIWSKAFYKHRQKKWVKLLKQG